MRIVERGAPAAEPAAAPTPEQSWKPDDDTIALELAIELKGKLAYFHSEWKMYETGCWRGRDTSELRRFIRGKLRGWRQRGVSVSQNRIKSLASMLEDDLFIGDHAIIDTQAARRGFINLRNGLYNLNTFEFEERHDPDLYFTSQLEFDYDPDADCPVFRRFLHTSLVHPDTLETDFSLVRLFMQALGYSMTARTDLKASFWLIGQKDSGKSTSIGLLKSIMGSLHATVDLNQMETNKFLLSGIVGKRVVSFTEASANTSINDALYKALVGGTDEIYADVKNRPGITFVPECKIWWAMNEMPRVNDRSGATTRRIFMIPFNRTIPESERISNLDYQITQERSGIFNWAITEYKRLARAGRFDECKQSMEMREQYIQENDTEATFIDQCAELDATGRISGSELYTRYNAWCIDNGFKPKNSNSVAKDWRRMGFQHQRSNGAWWLGLKLKVAK